VELVQKKVINTT